MSFALSPHRGTACALLIGLIAAGPAPAQSVTYTWDNTDGVFSDGSKWGGAAPGSSVNNILVFGGTGSTGYTATLDLGAAYLFQVLRLNSSSSATNTIAASPGNAFSFTATATNTSLIDQQGSGAFAINADFALGSSSNDAVIGGSGTGTVTLGGVISGSGVKLVKQGNFTLVLSGANTYAGETRIEGGTVQISAANNLGANDASNSVQFAGGGTLRVTNAVSIVGMGMKLRAGGGVIDTNGFDVSFGGQVTNGPSGTGAGTLTKTGAGTLTLGAGNNSFTGGVVINGGTLAPASLMSMPVTLNGGTLKNAGTFSTMTVQGGGGTLWGADAQISVGGLLTGTGPLTVIGTQTVIISGSTNSLTGAFTVDGGQAWLQGINPAVGMGNANARANPFSTVTVKNGGYLTGTRTDSLGGANTPIFLQNGGTVEINGVNGNGLAPITATGTGNRFIPRSTSGVTLKDIAGAGTFVVHHPQAGTTPLFDTLGGSNTFNGDFGIDVPTISSGASVGQPSRFLSIDSEARLGTGALSRLLLKGGLYLGSGPTNPFTISRPILIQGSSSGSPIGWVNGGGKTVTLAGPISGGLLYVDAQAGATMTLSGTNTHGATWVTSGTLSVATDANLGVGSLVLANGTTFKPAGPISGSRTLNGPFVSGQIATVDTDYEATFGTVSGFLSKKGTGTLTAQVPAFSNNSFHVSGGTLAFKTGITNSTGSATAITLNGGAVRFGASSTLGGLAVGGDGGTLDTNGTSVFLGTNPPNNTATPLFGLSNAVLAVTGGGTLVMAPVMGPTFDYRGKLRLNGGTFSTYGLSAFGNTAPLSGGIEFGGGEFVNTTGFNQNDVLSVPVTAVDGQNYRFGGPTTSTGSFEVTAALGNPASPAGATAGYRQGAGRVTLSGNNTFTGATVVPTGALTLGGFNGALSGTTGVTVSGLGSQLIVGQSSYGNLNRLNDAAGVTLNGGELMFRTSAPVTEVLRTLTLGPGSNKVTVDNSNHTSIVGFQFTGDPANPAATPGYNRPTGTGVLFRGYGLGTTAQPSRAARIFLDGVPNGTFLAGAVGDDLSIAGNNDLTRANGRFLVEYDTTLGVKPVTYTNVSFFGTGTTSSHVQISSATVKTVASGSSAEAPWTIPSLTLTSGQLQLDTNAPVVITTGMLLASAAGGNTSIGTAGNAVGTESVRTGGATPLTVYVGAPDPNFPRVLTISVPIDNTTGGLVKFGSGALTLSATNTYTGGTVLSGGKLVLGSPGGLPAGGAVTVNEGTLELNGVEASVGAVTLTGGLIQGGTLNATSFTQTGGTMFATLGGTSGLTVTAAGGSATLESASNHTGQTTIQSGTAVVKVDGALGSTAAPNPAAVVSGATLQLGASSSPTFNYSAARALAIAGTGADNRGAIVNGTTTASYAGPITLTDHATIYNPHGSTLTLSGTLTKNGKVLTIAGGGTVIINGQVTGQGANSDLVITDGTNTTLNAASDFNGPTYITGNSTLNLGNPNVMPAGSVVSFGVNDLGASTGAGTLNLNGVAQTVAGLSTPLGGATNLVTNSAGGQPPTLTLNVAAGQTYTFAGQIGGGTALTKTGPGTQVLSGLGTYSGATTVTGGTLAVNGPIQSNVSITPPAGQTAAFKGSGSTAGSLTVGPRGTVAPGNSPGTFTAASASFQADSVFNVELAGTQDIAAHRDQLTVSGILNFAAGAKVHVDLSGSPSFTAGQAYTYTIARAGSPIQVGGDPAGSLGQLQITSSFATGSEFSLARMDGSNLQLTYQPVPEPTMVLAVFLGGTAAAGWWRRRAGRSA